MLKQLFLLLISLPLIVSISKNTKLICSNCKNYIRPIYNEKFEIGNYLGKCSKFMEIDTLTNELKFKYAVKARLYESDCGSSAKYYEEDNVKTGDITPNMPLL